MTIEADPEILDRSISVLAMLISAGMALTTRQLFRHAVVARRPGVTRLTHPLVRLGGVMVGGAGVGGAVTGCAITAASRDPCFESRDSGVTGCTITTMSSQYRAVHCNTSIVAVQTRDVSATANNVAKGHVVHVPVSCRFVRVTGQAVGWVRTSCNRVDNFSTRAIVASGTRTGTVGGNVVLSALNLRPGCDHVTTAT